MDRSDPHSAPLPICHVELQVRDGTAARAFYGHVLGWTFAPASRRFSWIHTGAPVSAGLLQAAPGAPAGVAVFVAVEDPGAVLERARAAGATVVTPVRDVPGHGRYALLRDPEGNLLGLWERPGPRGA